MLPQMIPRVVAPTGYAGVRYVEVSVPRIDCLLVDRPEKYSLPTTPTAPITPPTPRRHPGKQSHSDAQLTEKRAGRRPAASAADLAELDKLLAAI